MCKGLDDIGSSECIRVSSVRLTVVAAKVRRVSVVVDDCCRLGAYGAMELTVLGAYDNRSVIGVADSFSTEKNFKVFRVDRIDSGTPRIDSYPSRDEIALPGLQGIDS
ncbi:hypothetical protein PIB30_089099 [Stylosanthes scabra]|uniref:Uncharacterized protein n=1 Tax=Stylosanthes scabra TaxID=79078 RepID=A0ABU6QTB8_9FABA|nr:hypothetical protein [Stylosanthes scabra]